MMRFYVILYTSDDIHLLGRPGIYRKTISRKYLHDGAVGDLISISHPNESFDDSLLPYIPIQPESIIQKIYSITEGVSKTVAKNKLTMPSVLELVEWALEQPEFLWYRANLESTETQPASLPLASQLSLTQTILDLARQNNGYCHLLPFNISKILVHHLDGQITELNRFQNWKEDYQTKQLYSTIEIELKQVYRDAYIVVNAKSWLEGWFQLCLPSINVEWMKKELVRRVVNSLLKDNSVFLIDLKLDNGQFILLDLKHNVSDE